MHTVPNLSHGKRPLDDVTVAEFQTVVREYYQTNKRYFPWRNTRNPYFILVSEIMLQQTQTKRVGEYYAQFLSQFPTIDDLATASLRDVLSVWQGLGYNRRAKYLLDAAQQIVGKYNGHIPTTLLDLKGLAGIGPNTAGAIMAYAYNQPVAFIETNIRSVFLHAFFRDQVNIHDNTILTLVAQTIDTSNPRDWYYALTDFGVYIKSHIQNPSRRSTHYTKQSRFEGSNRQLRSKIISYLTKHEKVSTKTLLGFDDNHARMKKIISSLEKDGLIRAHNSSYTL